MTIPASTVSLLPLGRLSPRSTRQVQHLRNHHRLSSNLPIFRFRNGFTSLLFLFHDAIFWTYMHIPRAQCRAAFKGPWDNSRKPMLSSMTRLCPMATTLLQKRKVASSYQQRRYEGLTKTGGFWLSEYVSSSWPSSNSFFHLLLSNRSRALWRSIWTNWGSNELKGRKVWVSTRSVRRIAVITRRLFPPSQGLETSINEGPGYILLDLPHGYDPAYDGSCRSFVCSSPFVFCHSNLALCSFGRTKGQVASCSPLGWTWTLEGLTHTIHPWSLPLMINTFFAGTWPLGHFLPSTGATRCLFVFGLNHLIFS